MRVIRYAPYMIALLRIGAVPTYVRRRCAPGDGVSMIVEGLPVGASWPGSGEKE